MDVTTNQEPNIILESTSTMDRILEAIDNIEINLKKLNLPIKENKTLGLIIKEFRNLSQNDEIQVTGREIPALYKKAKSILSFEDALISDPDIESIKKFMSRMFDFNTNDQSSAKDSLWEFDLFRRLKQTELKISYDEPDIVIDFEEYKYGIACKKIYSESSFGRAFKVGCRQLEKNKLKGIIAFNLDDLIPAGHGVDPDNARKFINNFHANIRTKHLVSFNKTSLKKHCDGILFWTEVFAISPDQSSKDPTKRTGLRVGTYIFPMNPKQETQKRISKISEELNKIKPK
ncbi:hypothetical protein OYC61_011685 [Alcaligenes nematophilus]|uniref:DUF3644 domain-containing protein n=1 Tax=Alcaligenes nematophilus TaxID=2994643 RepID=A0ABU3MU17_9BURK|nr:hypothetical protein [Alcaligenes nematophilus]MDT8466423.1 hypothetical protein [Alcaligenes nematophilus]MDT8504957.1 hypothetical protein [Alcaligenes nematophilus]MDT8526893.1 hypothetical protein [Alcaligenes nematophilus]